MLQCRITRRDGSACTRLSASSRPERVEHAGAVGADLDAGADLLQLGRLLVDLDVEAALEQRQRRGQSADAAADDDDLVSDIRGHAHSSFTPVALTIAFQRGVSSAMNFA